MKQVGITTKKNLITLMLKFQNLLPSSILKSNGRMKYVDVATRNFIVFRYAFCGHVAFSNTCMYIH